MHPSHTDWFNTCLEQVIPTRGSYLEAIALATQIDKKNPNLWRPFILLLTKDGEAIAGSEWLPIAARGNSSRLILTGDREALLVVTQRDQDIPNSIVDVPHWFSVTWSGHKIKVEEIGCWDQVNLGLQIRAASTDCGTVWVGSYRPDSIASSHLDTRLLLARSPDGVLPTYKFTEIDCVDVSDPVPFGDEIYVLVTARFERVELWAFDLQCNVRMVLEAERRKKTGKHTLGPGRLARCGDRLMMFWCYYSDRVGEKPKTWKSLLRAAEFDPKTQSAGEIINATADTRAIAATLEVHSLVDSLVVTWESRPKRGGGGMRAIRFSVFDDLPCEAVMLPEKNAPLFIPHASGPVLRSGRNPESSSWAIAPVPSWRPTT